MLSYYYAGRVSQDLGDALKAQDYYLKALDIDTHSADYALLARICSNLGMLYTYQDVFNEAMPPLKKALFYLEQLGDTISQSFVLQDIGRTYSKMDSIDLAIQYYERALQYAIPINRPGILNEMGYLFIEKKSYERARPLIEEALQQVSSTDYATVCLVLGHLFVETEEPDSARFYLQKSIGGSRLATRSAGYYRLYEIAKKEEKWKECVQFQELYNVLRDSLYNQKNTESIRRNQSLYDYHQVEYERNKAIISKTVSERNNAWLGISVILLAGSLGIFYFDMRKKKKEWKLKEMLRSRLSDKQIQESKQQIDKDCQRISELETELKKHTTERERFLEEKENLELKVEQNMIMLKKQESLDLKFSNSKIYIRLQEKKIEEKFSNDEKKELIDTIDDLWPDFKIMFKALYSEISNEDLYMCYLLKANLTLIHIGSIMNKATSTIGMKRKRLAQKILGEHAVPEDLDKLISSPKTIVTE
ncbi:MAG: tetratricopeptide repeat protein [Tannerella sp.]|nr:tetratricopeptide repeat protein [Tannerella sp.]